MDILLREAPHRFPGGLELPAMKDESTSSPIAKPPIPSQLILPLKQHAGSPAIPIVAMGEKVLKGQLIAVSDHQHSNAISANIHAPTSGHVVSVGLHPVAHASNMAAECIRLVPDGEDTWIQRPVTKRDWKSLSPDEIITITQASGIVGLGGAVFPSSIKLGINQTSENNIKALIINAAECEPYISCDDMLMREYAYDN